MAEFLKVIRESPDLQSIYQLVQSDSILSTNGAQSKQTTDVLIMDQS